MEYDSWIPGWDEPRVRACHNCEEQQQKYDELGEFLSELIEQLSSEKELDLPIVEHCLDEMCYRLQVKLFKNSINIQRRKKTVELPVKWLELAVS